MCFYCSFTFIYLGAKQRAKYIINFMIKQKLAICDVTKGTNPAQVIPDFPS